MDAAASGRVRLRPLVEGDEARQEPGERLAGAGRRDEEGRAPGPRLLPGVRSGAAAAPSRARRTSPRKAAGRIGSGSFSVARAVMVRDLAPEGRPRPSRSPSVGARWTMGGARATRLGAAGRSMVGTSPQKSARFPLEAPSHRPRARRRLPVGAEFRVPAPGADRFSAVLPGGAALRHRLAAGFLPETPADRRRHDAGDRRRRSSSASSPSSFRRWSSACRRASPRSARRSRSS